MVYVCKEYHNSARPSNLQLVHNVNYRQMHLFCFLLQTQDRTHIYIMTSTPDTSQYVW
jgi:hypothetical protein